jgi:hypothetical protein
MEHLPRPKKSDVPEHLPERVGHLFRQAEDALRRRNWDSAGATYRKTLDVGTRLLDRTLSGNLGPRIDQLAANSKITPDMKAWAHQIRLDGNDAAHDEDPFTEDEAKRLHEFTRLFLLYAFTLPGMLKVAQEIPSSSA